MTDRIVYQVIVEVDNKRAAAAFSKGLEELNALWPAIEAYCKPLDDLIKEREDKENKEFEKKMAAYTKAIESREAEMEEYHKAMNRWANSPFLGGPRPKRPESAGDSLFPFGLMSTPHVTVYHIRRYESERENLKRLASLASVANAPYKMEEKYALQMAAWESGERIAEIKQRIGSS